MIRIVLISIVAALMSGCGPSAKEQQAVADKQAQDARLEKSLVAAQQYFGREVKGSWGKMVCYIDQARQSQPFPAKVQQYRCGDSRPSCSS